MHWIIGAILCCLFWDGYWFQQVGVLITTVGSLVVVSEWMALGVLWTCYLLWYRPVGLATILAGVFTGWIVIYYFREPWTTKILLPTLIGILAGCILVFVSKFVWSDHYVQNMSQENIDVAE